MGKLWLQKSWGWKMFECKSSRLQNSIKFNCHWIPNRNHQQHGKGWMEADYSVQNQIAKWRFACFVDGVFGFKILMPFETFRLWNNVSLLARWPAYHEVYRWKAAGGIESGLGFVQLLGRATVPLRNPNTCKLETTLHETLKIARFNDFF